MFRLFAKRFAKVRYRWNQETEAATNDLHAKLAARNADDRAALVEKLTKEADEMDARIKEVSEQEEKGYWLCENGHENNEPGHTVFDKIEISINPICATCGKPATLIKRDQMTGQEKYESDKERKEAEDIVAQKRTQIAAEKENADKSKQTAEYFRNLAAQNRGVAEKIRRM